jgi:hypothetical protein
VVVGELWNRSQYRNCTAEAAFLRQKPEKLDDPCSLHRRRASAELASESEILGKLTGAHGFSEHHRLKSFQEEYVSFLKKHGIRFEERYLWD